MNLSFTEILVASVEAISVAVTMYAVYRYNRMKRDAKKQVSALENQLRAVQDATATREIAAAACRDELAEARTKKEEWKVAMDAANRRMGVLELQMKELHKEHAALKGKYTQLQESIHLIIEVLHEAHPDHRQSLLDMYIFASEHKDFMKATANIIN